MKIVFDGRVWVTCILEDEKSYLFLETGKGNGIVGEFYDDSVLSGRITEDELEKAINKDNVFALEFLNPKSVAAVIEQLQKILMYQLNMPIHGLLPVKSWPKMI